jgi:outer membrane immunogenic protein
VKELLIGAALVVPGVTSSQAADLAARPYTKAAPVAVPLTWTGCYIGANVGGGWGRQSFFDSTLNGGTNEGSNTSTGVVGGGQIGCDYQTGNWVFGIGGMVDGADVKGTDVIPGGSGFAWQTKIPWVATLTGRVGYAVLPSTLLYAKGGAAWLRSNYTLVNGAGVVTDIANTDRSGWTVGGGIEHLFAPNWSVFLEYDYMNFGTRILTVTSVPPGITFPVNFSQNMQTAIVGVNYRFGAH